MRQVIPGIILPAPTTALHAKFARVHVQAVLSKLRDK